MRKRDIVGRKIIDVRFSRFYNSQSARMETAIESIVLDNGGTIYLRAFETYDLPAVSALLVKRPKTEIKGE